MMFITLDQLCFTLPHKTCFENFSTHLLPGARVGVIGQNGTGKSTLLRILQGLIPPTDGHIQVAEGITMASVPQVIETHDTLSGGQRFNKALSQALAEKPDVLCLDEPTNHLDQKNRRSLRRMLERYTGTLVIVSHDAELLRTCVDTLWHLQNGTVHVFTGGYDGYLAECQRKRERLEAQLTQLNQEKKQTHKRLMKEQERAKKSKIYGKKKYADDKLLRQGKKRQGEKTTALKRREIQTDKEDILDALSGLEIPEILTPRFSLTPADLSHHKTIVSILEGACGYGQNRILKNLTLTLKSRERLALEGDNGAGKSTLIRALLKDPNVETQGLWTSPPRDKIGFLDQHYHTLAPNQSALEIIQEIVPDWSHAEIRRHLNDFLFRKNEEVTAPVHTLSGGEKARLSLAQMAAQSPRLLILDEMTNNIDLETRAHVIQVLRAYPGALIVISHDVDFLKEIGIERRLKVASGGDAFQSTRP